MSGSETTLVQAEVSIYSQKSHKQLQRPTEHLQNFLAHMTSELGWGV